MAYLGKTREPAFFFRADQTTTNLAKLLRKKMSPSECELWQCLRGKKLGGLKFRRQHPINFYIADFYCHQARLVVEVDGLIHNNEDQKRHDQQRTGIMKDFGIMVLRFSNDQVHKNLPKVLETIEKVAKTRIHESSKW